MSIVSNGRARNAVAVTNSLDVSAEGRSFDRPRIERPAVRGMSESIPWHAIVGKWSGRGRGSYPDVAPFDYLEETTIDLEPQWGIATVSQRTWLDRRRCQRSRTPSWNRGSSSPAMTGPSRTGARRKVVG